MAQEASSPTLETVTVQGVRGFSSDVSQIGGFRGAQLIDTPATIAVLPRDLLDAQQVGGMNDLLKNVAGANSAQTGFTVTSNQSIRGIPLDNRNGFRMDGSLPFVNLIDLPMEDKERVEVMKGAAGLYYGFASPAGVINVTLKRPTQDPMWDVKLFGNAFGGAGIATDFGGTVGNGKFGYRINGVYSGVNYGIDHQQGTRSLISGAFDYHPIESVTMQVDVEHIYKSLPEPGLFRFVTTPTPTLANPYPAIAIPDIKSIDPKTNFAPNWAQYRAEETNVLSHNVWSITDQFELSVDVGDSKFSRLRAFTTIQPTNILTGAGTEQFAFSTQQNENRNARIQAAGTFDTFGLTHNAMVGWSDNVRDTFSVNAPQTACTAATGGSGVYQGATTFAANPLNPNTQIATATACQSGITSVNGVAVNYLNPTFVNGMARQAAPAFTGNVGRIDDSGFYIFDRISYGEYVDLLAGGRFGNYNDITIKPNKIKNNHAAPATQSEGIVVKPFGNKDLSIYASYVEALETPGLGPITVVNAGQPLPPLPSAQREIGVKSEFFEGLLLTADYFNIHRAATYANAANFFVEDGQRKYEGFEVSAAGNVTDDLAIYANLLNMMAKNISGAPTCGPGTAVGTVGGTCKNFTPTIVGLQVSNTAKFYGSLFAQYQLGSVFPQLEGLAINGGMYYIGNRPMNDLNQANLGGYTTFDLGLAYSTDAFDYPMTFRINAANVGNARYWASGDANLISQGVPGTVNLSLEAHL